MTTKQSGAEHDHRGDQLNMMQGPEEWGESYNGSRETRSIRSCLFQKKNSSKSYDSEGRLTNVTFPTGVVTNLHGEMERAITVDIESSSREEDVGITSNLSSIDSFYTMVQDQLRNSYQIGYDGSLRIIYASGLDTHYQTEPHVLAGTANPTVAKRNMTLPGENGQNLVEWRFRKEQAQGKINVFGRKLRVSNTSGAFLV
ncbi:UNVERIFIED_CONTAM: Teneurin-3 [Gekko kuhli]